MAQTTYSGTSKLTAPLYENVSSMKTIIQISDTHLMDSCDEQFVKIDPELSFHQVMNDILEQNHKIDMIIHTGDIAQVAKPQTYSRYLSYMESLNIPFYQTPGNHDDLEIFPYPQNQPISFIHLDQWCIILLNSAVSGRIDGYIDKHQLQTLEELLRTHSNLHTIIGCHHHPVPMKSEWIDEHCLKNGNELIEILKNYPQVKGVINGHVHQETDVTLHQIRFLSVPSTSIQFKPKSKDFALDTIEPGYRCLYLHDNGHFETQVHRLDEHPHQINENISGY